jgi:hypothetical protein
MLLSQSKTLTGSRTAPDSRRHVAAHQQRVAEEWPGLKIGAAILPKSKVTNRESFVAWRK